MPDSGGYWINAAQCPNGATGPEKVSHLSESEACPYIVAGSICIMEGRRTWTCVRHRRIVSQAHCEECRLVLTRRPGI